MQVGGGILISGPAKVSGFNNLKKIGNYLAVQSSLTTHISGFDMLEEVKEISFSKNDELVSVEGFENVRNIDRIILLECLKLSKLTAFANVETLELGLELYLLGLSEITTFQKLRATGWLYFSANQNIKTLHYFPALEYAGGFRIDSNNNLHTIQFDKLSEVGWMSIAHNPVLVSPSFGPLNTAFSVNITNNATLTNLDFLQPFTKGIFYIHDNSALTDFCGLSNASGAATLSSFGNAYNPTIENIANGNCHL
jgi:hypothetical protein